MHAADRQSIGWTGADRLREIHLQFRGAEPAKRKNAYTSAHPSSQTGRNLLVQYAYAANRDIGSLVLDHLISKGLRPAALLLTDDEDEFTEKMVAASGLPRENTFRGKDGLEASYSLLRGLNLDYIVGVHYPYIVKKKHLELPKHGFLNLHPAYLPFNRGWHTPSWAILEGTPAGATLHFMSEELDQGDIVHQKRVAVKPSDTANDLYRRIKQAELEVFREALGQIREFSCSRKVQRTGDGSSHRKAELLDPSIAQLHLDELCSLEELLRRLRAMTTNQKTEACYFVEGGRKYRVTVQIQEEES